MNGRNLLAFVCVLFIIGIVWMIAVTPKEEISKAGVNLLQPLEPIAQEPGVASRPTQVSEQKEAVPSKEEPSQPSEETGPAAEEPEPQPTQVASDEPPEVVEYTPKYGQVTFTHMRHLEDYGIDCGDCHHEDLEGGLSKCTNCHEPPKEALHKNCQGCHKELKKEGKNTGPVGCRECHVKETG